MNKREMKALGTRQGESPLTLGKSRLKSVQEVSWSLGLPFFLPMRSMCCYLLVQEKPGNPIPRCAVLWH